MDVSLIEQKGYRVEDLNHANSDKPAYKVYDVKGAVYTLWRDSDLKMLFSKDQQSVITSIEGNLWFVELEGRLIPLSRGWYV